MQSRVRSRSTQVGAAVMTASGACGIVHGARVPRRSAGELIQLDVGAEVGWDVQADGNEMHCQWHITYMDSRQSASTVGNAIHHGSSPRIPFLLADCSSLCELS